MDFQIYEKIFKEKDDVKKYKILKNISYIKIKEHNDLKEFFSFLIHSLSEIISNPHQNNSRNDKFLLILLLILMRLVILRLIIIIIYY